MKDKFEESLSFVVRYYKRGALRPTMLFVAPNRWRRLAVAASIAFGIIVASACVYLLTVHEPVTDSIQDTTAPVASTPAEAPEKVSRRIKFDDAPLADVVQEIEKVYGVKVTPVADNDTTRLTLSYEGNAADLLDTINELLGTDLKLENTPKADTEK